MKPLNACQMTALRALAANPGATVEAGTLAFLRRNNLAGKHVEKPCAANGWRQKTTSPVTDAGRLILSLAADDSDARQRHDEQTEDRRR